MTEATSLTALQLEALRHVADGKVSYVRSGAGEWRVRGASASVIGRLERDLKFIERGDVIISAKDYYRFQVTEEGRAALAGAATT